MVSCLDNFQQQFADVDWGTRRNPLAAIMAGILFSIGIWLYIDTAAMYTPHDWNNTYVIVTLASIVAMFMVNAVSSHNIQADNYSGVNARGARLWLMIAFILSFSALVASMWLMFTAYVLVEGDGPKWPGVALVVSNGLIFASNLIYKFGRTEEETF